MCFSPPGHQLEESFGLGLLFKIRGPRKPPEEVVVIGIDQASARALNLSEKPERWPRILHARLLRALSEVGAGVVAFDIIFEEPRDPAHDNALAEAMQMAGNVVLVEVLRKEKLPFDSTTSPSSGQIKIEKLIQPIDLFKEVSVGLAPFPIPKVPVRVSQYWAFKTGAGNLPSLPVVAFQVFARNAYEDFLDLMATGDALIAEGLPSDRERLLSAGNVHKTVRTIRDQFEANPALASTMRAELSISGAKHPPLLIPLIRMYEGRDSRYLNFYGPPGTIRTIRYHELVDVGNGAINRELLSELKGKALFIGLSEREMPIKTDGFYTVYSQPDGVDLNGVEIAATAFGNLLENKPVRTLSPFLLILVIAMSGVILAFICRMMSYTPAGLVSIVYCAIFIWVVGLGFAAEGWFFPLVTVVFFQGPLAFTTGVIWRYVDVNKERKAIRHAFNFYLPPSVVDQIASGKKAITADGRVRHGAFLCTDMQHYTTLSEKTDPEKLYRFMHGYFETLLAPVRLNGGLISDIVGDSMMAIWEDKTPGASSGRNACESALQIQRALVDFWAANPLNATFPTRIGIHCGPVHIGNVGAGDHYEYQATGDTVNTVSRIENLNKHLGTQILVSEEALEGAAGFLVRRMGSFILSGKSNPVPVYELITWQALADSSQQELCLLFDQALAVYHEQNWNESAERFDAILNRYPSDGPSMFYRDTCRHYAANPPERDWDGVMNVMKK